MDSYANSVNRHGYTFCNYLAYSENGYAGWVEIGRENEWMNGKRKEKEEWIRKEETHFANEKLSLLFIPNAY